ncbi:chitin binding Peritrophin-A domain protein [Oesophagostomum dentatum]|uniref:Chitin binding Peritrophin-A domain protein n=1 Tax=Oesophagostomum dentatum TaxID=61180 RepID=A0A0B1SJ13_OESDE|nr:chitin binding Peritrophin-A domain protein [Oesophagostomum dentatum]
MACPANLVFDRTLKVCNYPRDVAECEGLIEDSGVCKEDGFFNYGNCSDQFYACSNGRQIPMMCPAKLAFDEPRQLCDYPMAVEICVGGPSGEAPPEGSGEGSGEGSERHRVRLLEKHPANHLVSMDPEKVKHRAREFSGDVAGEFSGEFLGEFVGEASGDFSGEIAGEVSPGRFSGLASGKFTGVASGKSSGISSGKFSGTATGTFTGEASGEYSGVITRGLSDEASGSSGEASGESSDVSVAEEAFQSKALQPQIDLATFCIGKPDSFYAIGCSSEMIACVAGAAQPMICPAHLIFDERTQMCDYPKNVPCSAAQQEEFECQTEGASSLGQCMSTFINCVEGRAYTLVCDDGYIFSETPATCVVISSVPECSMGATENSQV